MIAGSSERRLASTRGCAWSSTIEAGPLEPGEVGLTVDEAADLLAMFGSPGLWIELVEQRGWSPERFEAWLVDALAHQFLAGSPKVEPLPASD